MILSTKFARYCRPGCVEQSRGSPMHSNRLQKSCHAAAADRQPRPENKPGTFYVDHTCIDCDTCRWMDPETYSRVGAMSAVVHQPQDGPQRLHALQALLSCPTHSIHAAPQDLAPGEMEAAQNSMPIPVEGCPDVYHCGYHSDLSFGAASYFIRRPEGNILMDSPRFTPALVKGLEALGGVQYMVLSHCDDVADHAKWTAHFGCDRIMHATECNEHQGTDAVEHKLRGEWPWGILGEDCSLIFTPGHTAGSISLLHKPSQALLTGDHLAWSSRLHRLSIMRAYNWHSVPEQLKSVELLIGFDWLHILPGHGRRAHFGSVAERDANMRELLGSEAAP